MKFIYLIIFGLVFHTGAGAQEDWELKKNKNGIKVYSRKTKSFKMDELKVECVFEGRMSQLAAVLYDVNNQYKWVYKTSKSQLLKAVSPTDVFFYSEIEVPWPFDNRDLVVRMTMSQHPATRVVTIEAKSVNDYMAAKEHKVRIKYSNATWTVTPLNANQFRVDYRIQIDLGEGVPAWLVNMFSVNGPYESFVNLKEKIKQAPYLRAKFPYLVD